MTGEEGGALPRTLVKGFALNNPFIARAKHGQKAKVYFQKKPCAQHTEQRCRRRSFWIARRITRGERKAPACAAARKPAHNGGKI